MTDETGSQTNSETSPRTTTAQPRRSGGAPFAAALLGGFLAGGIGYLAAYYTEFGLFETGGDDPLAGISETLSTQDERLAEISSRLEAVESTDQFDPTETNASIAALEEQIAELRQQTTDQAAQLSQADPAEEIAGLSEQVEALAARLEEHANTIEEQASLLEAQRQTLDQQSAAIEDAGAAATAEANRVSVQAALTGIDAALSTGRPFAEHVGALQSAADVTVPEPLAAVADEGVATLGSLQEDYDAAARAALSASVAATAGGSVTDRFGAFLRSQTNARSLSEREGENPDAILSRAGARLAEGDLEAALNEISTLPEAGQDAMSDWLDRARTRVAAVAAFSDLSSSVTAN